MIIFWLTCLVGYPRTSAPEPFYGSTTEVRRQIGNAVPPVGVHAIAMALKPLFTGDYPKVDLYKKLEILKAMPFEERYKLIK